ncbi:hypothetical protein M2322_001091 [Rhodoblastus acidophilus]|uniref:hypothetical protein n=1 Tax=Rhodoblastus acidophilus TaxID=1074 RepID=UPI002224F3C3|nr:hypothetical protein [Rhodoblastus acidophilus]MCW2315557.1 hypothetical protein [Rhodoblastus acidophilus]
MAAPRACFSLAATCALPFILAGCSGGLDPTATASVQSAPSNVIRPSGLSPRPATVAVTQMDAPEPLKSQFMALFNADVAQQDVALTNSAGARYLARGYISAYPVEDGARLTYVWDIYDGEAHRAQRLNDEIALKGVAADPWTLVDAAALSALAQRSAGELAAYLSNTPEALAAAQPTTPAATASVSALSYAPIR